MTGSKLMTAGSSTTGTRTSRTRRAAIASLSRLMRAARSDSQPGGPAAYHASGTDGQTRIETRSIVIAAVTHFDGSAIRSSPVHPSAVFALQGRLIWKAQKLVGFPPR